MDSQLVRFLKALTSEERQKLVSGIELKGKEKQFFDTVLASLNSSDEEDNRLLQELNVSQSYFHKVSSVLLNKSYRFFFPEYSLALLTFLRNKTLYTHYKHEFLQQEKKLGHVVNDQSLADYYLKVFHNLIELPFTVYDEQLVSLAGQRYLACLPGPDTSMALYVDRHMLFSDINRLSARKNRKLSDRLTLDYLNQKLTEIENSRHYLALYYTYRSFVSYFTYIEPDYLKAEAYLLKAMNYKEHIAWFFPINIVKFLDLMYADMLFFNTRIQEAAALYETIFRQPLEKEMYGYYYHCEQWVLINIITEQYERAADILEQYFRQPIELKLDIYATRGAMSFTKLYLSKGMLKEALEYLNVSKGLNETAVYHPFEFQIRVLELMYFFLKKDFDFAEHLCQRNLKTILASGEKKRYHIYVKFYRLSLKLLHATRTTRRISTHLMEEFREVERLMENLYVKLPLKLLETVRTVKGAA